MLPRLPLSFIYNTHSYILCIPNFALWNYCNKVRCCLNDNSWFVFHYSTNFIHANISSFTLNHSFVCDINRIQNWSWYFYSPFMMCERLPKTSLDGWLYTYLSRCIVVSHSNTVYRCASVARGERHVNPTPLFRWRTAVMFQRQNFLFLKEHCFLGILSS